MVILPTISLPAPTGDVFQGLLPPTELTFIRHYLAPGLQVTECRERVHCAVQDPLHSSL